ncbi:TetR/AcrR family transcriptional regulator [Rothia sp. HC945]|uniref:TetR/AcrR family transcriptional regulator n=1 Tax=Rothia sp. HC945 TaxID=3171170 RepID=UPI003F206250
MTDGQVPGFLQRLWRLQPVESQRGRRPTLDVETVVNTAVQLADSDGLDGATLSKVAEELGVTPMSLYRYIGSKYELLQLMLDAAGVPQGPAPITSGWRDGLRLWALDLWSLYQDRPWLPRVPIYRAPSGPNQIAWLERGLAQLACSKLGWEEKLAILTLLSGYVRQSALLHNELEQGRDPGQSQSEGEREYGQALYQVVSSGQFPHTSAMLRSGALGHEPEQDDESNRGFLDGLEVIFDGIAVRIAAASEH